jgi:hypothetical protein
MILFIKFTWHDVISRLSKFITSVQNAQVFESVEAEFWTVVIFAPLGETFLFQYLVFIVLDYINLGKRWIVLISASLFSFIHNYSLFYTLYAFGSGIIHGYVYWLSQVKYKFPFMVVALIHALHNLYIFLIKYNKISFML